MLTRSAGSSAAVDSPLIDPRLRARRIEVERGRVKRRLRRVVVLIVLAAAVGGCFAITRSALVDVDEVTIVGVVGQRATVVAQAAAIDHGDAMTDTDPAAVRRRIEDLAWVESVQVERNWPGTVAITVAARVPVGVDARGFGVDASGTVIGPVEATTSLPQVDFDLGEIGSNISSDHKELITMLEALPPQLRAEVASVTSTDGAVELTLTDSITVHLGDSSRLTAKFNALEALLDQADRATIDRIDVRVPSTPSLTRLRGAGA